MGWWDSLWASSSSPDDPLRNLDPKLREFLAKESPVRYNAATDQKPPAQEPKAVSSGEAENAITEKKNPNGVPAESQFQDGRYAHLWKTYRPLAEIEAETKTDHEKLMDVLEGYKERRSQIGRAALENCALEQVDWRTCMTNPSFTERMTMCRDQVRKFERCYMMQTRLLKALGYLSTYDRTPEAEEEIQMHADSLYQRLVAQEAEVDAAKREGRPIPTFPPLIPKKHDAIAAAAAAGASRAAIKTIEENELTPEQQEKLKARLEKVAEEERSTEEAAYRAELHAKAELASRVQGLWKQQEQERQERREKGKETLWDQVAGVFGGSSSNKSGSGGDGAGEGGPKKSEEK
ncbi:hypothetical protein F4809DRAFT_624425 [Biscogniauxia mediterranea]|nr:hypothetical protein F4809DRAFT_624425 [Biscogniauxia mediterranea]